MPTFDFGLGSDNNSGNTNEPIKEPTTSLDDVNQNNNAKEPSVLNSENNNNINPKGEESDSLDDKSDKPNGDGQSDDSSLKEGSVVTVGEDSYTVDANGNLLDKDNNIFKSSNEVAEWFAQFETVDDDEDADAINLANIQKAIGIDLSDENGNPVEFENSIEGIKSYINGVVEANREENYRTAFNSIQQQYPFIDDVINYWVANNNSLEGYNEIPDRSKIEVIPNNTAQHEAIIRQAWAESKRPGNIEDYLQYLKSSGNLEAVARDELKGLQQLDADYRERIAQQAEEVEAQQQQYIAEYWKSVQDIVQGGKIAGYDIPETISVNRDGRTIAVGRNEFFNYLYQVDGEGKSMYQRDIEATDETAQLQDQLLRAYLMFTGGSYADLVTMADNKNKVKHLKLTAKNSKKPSIRINRNNSNKPKDLDFGI
jgi:hypothetical protein|nr:MAG TPA: hypothetical protein [Crassvirales sp.]